jgi:hypothetical protein
MLDFPNGKLYHHNKTYINELKNHERIPYVFHMCWTANSVEKVSISSCLLFIYFEYITKIIIIIFDRFNISWILISGI